MKLNFNEFKILRLCSDFPFMMNHRKNVKYYIINTKIDKICRAIDNMIKENCFLNKIWLKLCRSSSKFDFVLIILKTHKNKTMLFILHFSKMFMCVKRVNCYFIVFLMLVTSRFMIFSRELSSIWYFYMI